MKVNSDANTKLIEFIKKPKFEPQTGTVFNGLSKPILKPQLTAIINQAAKDFVTTVNNHPTEAKFQNNIGSGLAQFNKLYIELDTEDRERICTYFEELMDCVGLESSNGQLNNSPYAGLTLKIRSSCLRC